MSDQKKFHHHELPNFDPIIRLLSLPNLPCETVADRGDGALLRVVPLRPLHRHHDVLQQGLHHTQAEAQTGINRILIKQPTNQPNKLINQQADRSVYKPILQPAKLTNNKPTNPSTNQSTNQSPNQPTNPPTS